MTRKEREELCKLSEESFGTKYAWLSYLRTPEYVKETDALTKRTVKLAKWRTLEDVIAMMKGKVNELENVPKSETIVTPINASETQVGSGDSEQTKQDSSSGMEPA